MRLGRCPTKRHATYVRSPTKKNSANASGNAGTPTSSTPPSATSAGNATREALAFALLRFIALEAVFIHATIKPLPRDTQLFRRALEVAAVPLDRRAQHHGLGVVEGHGFHAARLRRRAQAQITRMDAIAAEKRRALHGV